MIISASRRTDIPTYYSEWFANRIREGYVLVRNPMNVHQISRVRLSRDVVDGIVFWTKNPIPMMRHLDDFSDYTYYFQFSITSYGKDVEPNIPDKQTVIIPAFKELSKVIGTDRIVWRYDPILINSKYTVDYHMRAFKSISGQLQGYTEKCTISFVDYYRNTTRNMKALDLTDMSDATMRELSSSLAEIAGHYGLRVDTCAEVIDLQQFGIEHARCIDNVLFERLLNARLDVEKDKNQRPQCGCVAGIDIGAYNTCGNGCRYCYANYNETSVHTNCEKHNPASPLLFGNVSEDDVITEREMKSYINPQIMYGDIRL
jgi:hypothetical protein